MTRSSIVQGRKFGRISMTIRESYRTLRNEMGRKGVSLREKKKNSTPPNRPSPTFLSWLSVSEGNPALQQTVAKMTSVPDLPTIPPNDLAVSCPKMTPLLAATKQNRRPPPCLKSLTPPTQNLMTQLSTLSPSPRTSYRQSTQLTPP